MQVCIERGFIALANWGVVVRRGSREAESVLPALCELHIGILFCCVNSSTLH